jgi:hypothetical protein
VVSVPHGPNTDRGSGLVRSRTPPALRSSATRDRIGRVRHQLVVRFAHGPAAERPEEVKQLCQRLIDRVLVLGNSHLSP